MKNYFCIFLWEGLPEKEGVQFCLGGRGVGGYDYHRNYDLQLS